ncbi:sulfotransferase domain-containing protein [Wenzhouxiangella sp. EGI_FJ10305]|uniref:sulfotransferase domain-containing protein n=1 Tax=Wenzhouxiangella sp. EGI_FJ10305 TaxID=3243768 RepID=UPI0035D7B8EC
MPSPDFIVIGGMKCGTTSLYHYLGHHPEVTVSRKKEVNYFFGRLYNKRSYAWYRRQFPDGGVVTGDVSPVYSKLHLDPEVPRRIHSALPHVRLIYLVRDPVQRFISHYQHSLAKARTTLRADAFVESELRGPGNVFLTGCYYKHLKGYLEYFSHEQILIVECEKLWSQTTQELDRIFRFIGVSEESAYEGFDQVHHSSSSKYVLNPIGARLRKLVGAKQALAWSRSPIGRKLLYRPMQSIALDAGSRAALERAYAPWNNLLRDLCGMPLESWPDYSRLRGKGDRIPEEPIP